MSGLSVVLVFWFFLIFVCDMRKVKFKNVKELYGGESEVFKPKAWNFLITRSLFLGSIFLVLELVVMATY